jgi:hypothetical protein
VEAEPVRRLASITVAVTLTGCSFATLERLPDQQPVEQTPRCSRSWVPVGLDVLATVAFTIATAGVASSSFDDDALDTGDKARAVSLPAAVAFLYGSSLWWGYHQLDRCGSARDAHERFLRERGGAPGSSL